MVARAARPRYECRRSIVCHEFGWGVMIWFGKKRKEIRMGVGWGGENEEE